MSEPKWLRFIGQEVPPERKTRIWAVFEKDRDVCLGQIRWFGRWRQYAFFTDGEMIFERQCLRDIADFCEAKTKEHRTAGRSSSTQHLEPSTCSPPEAR